MQLPNISNDSSELVVERLDKAAKDGNVEAMKEMRSILQSEYHDALIEMMDDDEYNTTR